MTDERRAYLREHKRKQRQKARERGDCIVCTNGKPAAGNVVCDECVNRSVEWERAHGWRSKAKTA
jgi:hypothetical protein